MHWRNFVLLGGLGLLPSTLAAPNVKRQAAIEVASGSHTSTETTASQTASSETSSPAAASTEEAPPVVSHPTSLPHTPYTGTATTTGALTASSIGPGIPTLDAAPEATSYPSNGELNEPQPGPYIPAGGVGTNGSAPVYNAKSDFDFQSLALALYQEYIELDLFHDGLARFSEEDFIAAGLSAEDRYLIQFMAEQEVGHATMLTNILGPKAPRQCVYNYPYTTVHEFIDFCQKLTRFGEAGVYGFLAHLDSREAATLLTQAITTEARQQMIFRQFEGLFPMPVWFEVGVPQSWAWTLLAPHISSCPENQTRLVWQNFPALYIENQPNPFRINGSAAINETIPSGGMNVLNSHAVNKTESCLNSTTVGVNCNPGITRNRTEPLSYPGRTVQLSWDHPGAPVGPNNSYITNTTAGDPKYVVWASQLNITYTPLNISDDGRGNYGTTIQPNMSTYAGDPAINGTIFIAITDSDPYLTPFNFSSINSHVVAGPALYQSG